MTPRKASGRLLTSHEVAKIFRVDPKTVVRWAKSGKLPSIQTPGGRHRYPEDVIRSMVRTDETTR